MRCSLSRGKKLDTFSPINPLLKDYSSCLYFAVVSESTVGYGDTNAVTFIGRCLAIVMIVMGNTFTSLVLIFIIRSITFTSTEEDAHFRKISDNISTWTARSQVSSQKGIGASYRGVTQSGSQSLFKRVTGGENAVTSNLSIGQPSDDPCLQCRAR